MHNEHQNPEQPHRGFMLLAAVFVCLSMILLLLWSFKILVCPLILVFLPHCLANVFGAIAFWKRSKLVSVLMIVGAVTLLGLVLFLQTVI